MDKQLVSQPNVRAIQQVKAGSSADNIPHISFEHVQQLAQAAKQEARKGKGERDQLLIQTIFDGMFRIAEALTLRPNLIVKDQDGFSARIVGKGKRSREVALSPTIANRLLAYAYEFGVEKDQPFFPITPTRAWQIISRAFKASGIVKPEGVGTVHVLRHSGSIDRVAKTGNPKATQDQGGWTDARMMLRYMKTLSAKESIQIQKQVDNPWRG